jgi:hypothetical protein
MLWYYADGGQQRGPVSQEELQRLVTAGTIAPSALVWKEGMGAWEPLASVANSAGISIPDPSSIPAAASLGASGDAGTSAGGAPATPLAEGMVMCAECGKATLVGETVEFERRHVCAQCKPRLLQRLSEGAAMPTSNSGTLSEAEVASRDYHLDFALPFEEATAAVKFEPMILIVATIFFVGAMAFMGALSVIPLAGVFIQMIAQIVLLGPIMGGLLRVAFAAMRKQPVDFAMIFWGFGPRFGQLVLVQGIPQLLSTLVFLPMTLIGVTQTNRGFGAPGANPLQALDGLGMISGIWMLVGALVLIFLTIRWMYAPYLVVDKNYKALDALRLSYKVVGKHWFRNALAFIMSGFISALGVLLCCVGLLITVPFGISLNVSFYKQIFDRLESKSAGL